MMNDLKQIKDILVEYKVDWRTRARTTDPLDLCIATLDRMMAARGDTQAALDDLGDIIVILSRCFNMLNTDTDPSDILMAKTKYLYPAIEKIKNIAVAVEHTAQPAESVWLAQGIDVEILKNNFFKDSGIECCGCGNADVDDTIDYMVKKLSQPKQPDVNAELLECLQSAIDIMEELSKWNEKFTIGDKFYTKISDWKMAIARAEQKGGV